MLCSSIYATLGLGAEESGNSQGSGCSAGAPICTLSRIWAPGRHRLPQCGPWRQGMGSQACNAPPLMAH